ncbi:E3 ubiquitin-protein ligase RNF135 isoform X7 [Pogona vitticeps]
MAAVGGTDPGRCVALWLKADDLQCPICFCLLSSPATLPCGHSFCLGCIRRWAQSRGRSCPNCGRGSLKKLPERTILLERVLEQYRRAASNDGQPEGRWLPPSPSSPPLWAPSLEALAGQPADAADRGLQDVMKISELPQQIEATLKAIASWKKDDTEMKEHVSQIKRSVVEVFSFLNNYINDREKMVLNFIDKEYREAQQKRDLTDYQLKARNEQLLELQINSKEVIKNTSLEQEVCIENPIKMTDVALAVEKIKSITYVVEEFRRQLEKSVLWNRPVKLPQESTLGKHQNNEIQKEAEVEMASSSISTQSQDSLQEASSSSSAMSSITEDDILSVNLSTCGTPLDCSQHERRRSRPAIHRADSIISSQFSQWAANVTLDLKTLNDRLELSEDKKKVTVSDFFVGYEHSAQRFCVSQVLGCQGFSDGCHYWEVITEDATGWAIGIAYKEIGKRDKLGRTELSWCVEWSVERLSAWHGDRETHIGNRKPLRVGVFLDIPESCLSFYSLTDQETCLHKFEIHVANPVYPAFWIFGMNAGECLTIAKSGTSPL